MADPVGIQLETVGQRLRVVLAVLNWTQSELAERLTAAGLRTDKNTVSDWVLDRVEKPDREKVEWIAYQVGLPVGAVLTGPLLLSIGAAAAPGRVRETQVGPSLVRLSPAEANAMAQDLAVIATRLMAATSSSASGSPAAAGHSDADAVLAAEAARRADAQPPRDANRGSRSA